MDWEPLVAAATRAREQAYAPYSRFQVGAAFLMEDGSVVAAANCENCLPALSICAERATMAAASAQGLRRPQAIAVVTDASPPALPCGLCRQTLVEFVDDVPILSVNTAGARRLFRLTEIFPEPFRLRHQG